MTHSDSPLKPSGALREKGTFEIVRYVKRRTYKRTYLPCTGIRDSDNHHIHPDNFSHRDNLKKIIICMIK